MRGRRGGGDEAGREGAMAEASAVLKDRQKELKKQAQLTRKEGRRRKRQRAGACGWVKVGTAEDGIKQGNEPRVTLGEILRDFSLE